jgi:hypothetical protein
VAWDSVKPSFRSSPWIRGLLQIFLGFDFPLEQRRMSRQTDEQIRLTKNLLLSGIT